MEDKIRELAIKHLPKAFYQYGYKGFTCQVHYPELCKIVKDYESEYKQSIITLVDEELKNYHTYEEGHYTLTQLKQKIEAL